MHKLTHAQGVPGIYAIVHAETGKAYVGSSVDIGMRWLNHRSDLRAGRHANSRLQAAWAEHGEDAFRFLIVEHVPENLNMRSREQAWLDESGTADPERGYNRSFSALGAVGCRWTPEQRARASVKSRARGKSDAWRAAMANQSWTPARLEQVAALGRATKGVRRSAATRRKIGDVQRGSKDIKHGRSWLHVTGLPDGRKRRLRKTR